MVYLDDFVKKYNGRLVDDDGAFGNQCVDLIRRYVREVFNTTPKPTGNGYATGYFHIFQAPMNKLFTKVANNPKNANQIPPRGSVFVLNEKTPGSGGAGHTGIVLSSNKKEMTTFEQNSPSGTPCVVKTRNYLNLLGWLVPIKSVDPAPKPAPKPVVTPKPVPVEAPKPTPKPVLEPEPVEVPPVLEVVKVEEPKVVIEVEESKKYTFNKSDLISIGKGLLIALAGAGLTYLAQISTEVDFGEWTPIIVVLLSVLVNIGRKFIAGK